MSEALDSLHPTLRELPGTTIVGRYKVDEALGVGGMGAVFRGHHLGLKRDVAIKVLHPDLTRDPEISKRFDREAHSASRLDHPNCLRVTDVGSTDDGVKFMVMDLLAGAELADRMGEPIPAERAVLMVLQVLRGLEHAHEHGVVHRDIKPENIFVTRDHDGREILKLVDFGIAKLGGGGTNDTRMTKAGLIFGTPAYMSPEQAMGMEADARADLYAVGVILYEMLGGTPPFESDDPVKLVRMQVSKDPPPLPDDVAPPLAELVMKLLAKDRDERFQSATEAREALELILPAIASSDVISGVTILGSTTSGPIIVNPGNSVPIPMSAGSSGPMPVAISPPSGPFPFVTPGESSGTFSPSSLPTLPPGAGAMKRPRSKLPLYGGAAVVVLALVAWIAGGDDEPDDPGDPTPSVVEPAGDGDEGSKAPLPEDGGAGAGGLTLFGPDQALVAEVDRLIFRKDLSEAEQKLEPMLDEFPDNAVLLWRQGRIFDKKRNNKQNKLKALSAYGDAIEQDPALLDDQVFYAELHELLQFPKLSTEALDFALRKMGDHGHQFLLELVNADKPLRYADRQRVLQELAKAEKNEPLVDWRRHRALDLWQAKESTSPCTTYRKALEDVSDWDEYKYLSEVEGTKVPKPKTGDELTDEEKADAKECEGLEERRAEVIEQLQAYAPVEDTDGELVIDDEESGESKGGGSKGGGSKSGGNKGGGSKGGGSKGKSGGGGGGGSGSGGKKSCRPIDFFRGKCK